MAKTTGNSAGYWEYQPREYQPLPTRYNNFNEPKPRASRPKPQPPKPLLPQREKVKVNRPTKKFYQLHHCYKMPMGPERKNMPYKAREYRPSPHQPPYQQRKLRPLDYAQRPYKPYQYREYRPTSTNYTMKKSQGTGNGRQVKVKDEDKVKVNGVPVLPPALGKEKSRYALPDKFDRNGMYIAREYKYTPRKHRFDTHPRYREYRQPPPLPVRQYDHLLLYAAGRPPGDRIHSQRDPYHREKLQPPPTKTYAAVKAKSPQHAYAAAVRDTPEYIRHPPRDTPYFIRHPPRDTPDYVRRPPRDTPEFMRQPPPVRNTPAFIREPPPVRDTPAFVRKPPPVRDTPDYIRHPPETRDTPDFVRHVPVIVATPVKNQPVVRSTPEFIRQPLRFVTHLRSSNNPHLTPTPACGFETADLEAEIRDETGEDSRNNTLPFPVVTGAAVVAAAAVVKKAQSPPPKKREATPPPRGATPPQKEATPKPREATPPPRKRTPPNLFPPPVVVAAKKPSPRPQASPPQESRQPPPKEASQSPPKQTAPPPDIEDSPQPVQARAAPTRETAAVAAAIHAAAKARATRSDPKTQRRPPPDDLMPYIIQPSPQPRAALEIPLFGNAVGSIRRSLDIFS